MTNFVLIGLRVVAKLAPESHWFVLHYNTFLLIAGGFHGLGLDGAPHAMLALFSKEVRANRHKFEHLSYIPIRLPCLFM